MSSMILHADPVHHRLALLSIPRDLFIPNARSTGPNKVDAGLFQGLTQLVGAIEEDFGIPDPARRIPQLRSVRQHHRHARRHQHVVSDLRLRRRIRLECPSRHLRPSERDPGAGGGAGPTPAVRQRHHQSVCGGLASGEPERPGRYSVAITSFSGCWGRRWPSREWGIRSPISI